MESLYLVLQALNVIEPGMSRQDADNVTMTIDRQLALVKTRTYDQVYPALKGRQFVPNNPEMDPAAEEVIYYRWDSIGMAHVLATYADDLPMVDAFVSEEKAKIVPLGTSFNYSVQDLRRAIKGVPLVAKKGIAARKSVEDRVDYMLAFGHIVSSIYGLLNNPNVSFIAPLYGSWNGGSTTGMQMAQDMLHFVSQFVILNKETFMPTDIILSVTKMQKIAVTPTSTTGDSTYTALKFFYETCPVEGLRIKSWNKCATADSAGTGARAVCYTRSLEVLEGEEMVPYEQLPPQAKNFVFKVPVHARHGGVVIFYPIGVAYMDGL